MLVRNSIFMIIFFSPPKNQILILQFSFGNEDKFISDKYFNSNYSSWGIQRLQALLYGGKKLFLFLISNQCCYSRLFFFFFFPSSITKLCSDQAQPFLLDKKCCMAYWAPVISTETSLSKENLLGVKPADPQG